MPKSDIIRLQHMLDAAQKAVQFSEGRQRADLDSDDMFSLAVVRLIEVVGEAASKIEEETQKRYPDIQWRSIISARNRLIHGYDDVDLDIVWSILTLDLPELVQQIEHAIQSEKKDE